MHSPRTLYLCRAGFEPSLEAEWRAKASDASGDPLLGDGFLSVPVSSPLPPPFIFERQRIPSAGFVPINQLNPLPDPAATAILEGIRDQGPWSFHTYAARPEEGDAIARRAQGFERALLRFSKKQDANTAALHRKRNAKTILQLCFTKTGLWYGVSPASDLSDTFPGGIRRMRMDADAPSRSYLKLEEALARLGIEPQPKEMVIDLGAAPGGWTYAFLKRGCHVLAVDNGPLKLTATAPGRVQHQRADGISFAPPPDWQPVDWMVCDMLVAPGKTLGLLRRWTNNRWLRRFICNMKLPQQNPYPALQPVEAWLADSPHIRASIRQLYHDRREVTIYGRTQCGPPDNTLRD